MPIICPMLTEPSARYISTRTDDIVTCKAVARYNENTAEQTEADRAAYTEQAKYVAKFDKMMKDGKIKRMGILAKEEAKLITEVQAEAVPSCTSRRRRLLSLYGHQCLRA